jgi:Mg-chelatase subunit ChlD
MKESVPVVKRVLKGYLDSLKEGIFLKLIKYTNKVFNLSDFTREPALLKKAVESEVLGRGNTDTFKGLIAAIESIKIKDGNRAIIAILDELVCQTRECKQQYIELWDAILDTGIVFSTIGVQSGWHEKTRYFGNTNYQIFSEFAYATGGEFYHSPSDELIKESTGKIFKQMTSPVKYLVKAAIEEKKEEIKKEPKVKKPGAIQVLFEKGAEKEIEKNIELILDASNSMWGQIQGRSKIEIAREVLIKLVRGLPDKINVGLRVYGHRYKLKDRRACKDSELIVQIGKLNKDKMIKIINRIIPRGKTPLVYSILQTPGDFKNIGKGTVILISDGIESCNGDINSVASILKKSGLDLKVHIVGFDIKGQQARKQLEMIAESTGGRYLDAKNSRELLSSLEKTLQFEYHILNDKGKLVAQGYVGGKETEVMEGNYTLRLMVDSITLEKAVVIGPDSKLRFILKRENNKWIVNKE